MKNRSSVILISAFSLFILVHFILLPALPKKDFSERENRYLQVFPPFSFSSLISGNFSSDVESYTSDHFPFRDDWTTLKARIELLIGKQENNEVFYSENGYLLKRFYAPDEKLIQEQVGYVRALSENVDVPVAFALIPDSVCVLQEKLPKNAPTDDELRIIDIAYEQFGGQVIDIASSLLEHKDEYIYYRTDHHWTSLGAFYGANAILEAFELSTNTLSLYQKETLSDEFLGTTYSSSGYSWCCADSIDIYIPETGVSVVNYSSGAAVSGKLYDRSKLDAKDKYAVFLGGNTPRVDIHSDRGEKKLLIIRDSFSDCMLPFLLDVFSDVTMLDMRYFKPDLSAFIEGGDFDQILVVYSVREFCEDSSLFMMAY